MGERRERERERGGNEASTRFVWGGGGFRREGVMFKVCSGGGWTEDTKRKTQVCHLKEGSDGNNVG